MMRLLMCGPRHTPSISSGKPTSTNRVSLCINFGIFTSLDLGPGLWTRKRCTVNWDFGPKTLLWSFSLNKNPYTPVQSKKKCTKFCVLLCQILGPSSKCYKFFTLLSCGHFYMLMLSDITSSGLELFLVIKFIINLMKYEPLSKGDVPVFEHMCQLE